MAETSDQDFDLLVMRGKALGLFVQRHRYYDPCRPGGDLYVTELKGRWLRMGKTGNPPSILKFATADTVSNFLKGT